MKHLLLRTRLILSFGVIALISAIAIEVSDTIQLRNYFTTTTNGYHSQILQQFNLNIENELDSPCAITIPCPPSTCIPPPGKRGCSLTNPRIFPSRSLPTSRPYREFSSGSQVKTPFIGEIRHTLCHNLARKVLAPQDGRWVQGQGGAEYPHGLHRRAGGPRGPGGHAVQPGGPLHHRDRPAGRWGGMHL